MSQFYLLEDLPSRFIPDEKAILVSLDPHASKILDDLELTYTIAEDYYSESAMWRDDSEYLLSQIDWFNRLDRLLDDCLNWTRTGTVDAASINYLRIKYFVDSVIMNARIIEGIVSKIKPDNSITYVFRQQSVESFSFFDFAKNHRSLFKRQLIEVCKKKGIVLQCLNLAASASPAGTYRNKKCRHSLRRLFRSVKTFIQLKKYHRFFSQKKIKDTTAIFLHTGSLDIDLPMQSFFKQGGNPYIQSDDTVYLETLWSSRLVFRLTDKTALSGDLLDFSKLFTLFERDQFFLSWINERADFDVQSICRPYFEHFFLSDLKQMFMTAQRMADFFEDNKVESVVVRGNSDFFSAASLLGARIAKISRICLQHSGLGINKSLFPVFETCSYDYLWTRDSLSQEYFQTEVQGPGKQRCSMLETAHVWSSLMLKRPPRLSHFATKQTIMYLETRFPGHLRSFNNPSYSLTAYYAIQKQVIDFMVKRTDVDWIFKHAPRDDYASPILDYIGQKNATNIRIESMPFVACLNHVDKVFMDYFSTAFYESVMLGVPVYCSIYRDFGWIDSFKEQFGSSAGEFRDAQELIGQLKVFVSEPVQSSKYCPSVPIKQFNIDSFITDFFNKVLRGKAAC